MKTEVKCHSNFAKLMLFKPWTPIPSSHSSPSWKMTIDLVTVLSVAPINCAFCCARGFYVFSYFIPTRTMQIGIIIFIWQMKALRHRKLTLFAHSHRVNKCRPHTIFKFSLYFKIQVSFSILWPYAHKAIPYSGVKFNLFMNMQSFNQWMYYFITERRQLWLLWTLLPIVIGTIKCVYPKLKFLWELLHFTLWHKVDEQSNLKKNNF